MIDIKEHMNLVPYVINNMQNSMMVLKINYEKEDLLSLGYEALYNACQKYDESRGIKFTTFACRCITNIILKMLNRERYFNIKYKLNNGNNSIISMEELYYDDNDNTRLVNYKITNDFDFEEQCTDKVILKQGFSVLDDREKNMVIMYYFQGISQGKIGKMYNCSQNNVSLVIKSAIKKMRKEVVGYI